MNRSLFNTFTLSVALACATTWAQAPATSPATRAASPEIAGPIEFYSFESQIGIAASREIKRDGRTVAIIFYRAKNHPAVKESDLVEAGIRRITYDEKGRPSGASSTVGGIMPLQQTEYNDDNSVRRITWYHSPGRPSHRNIYANGTCKSELHYNDDGVVAGIRHEVLPDNDLPAWGKPVNDVACGLLTSAARGTFNSLGLWITARNLGKDEKKIVTIGKEHPEFLVEVRSADGTVIPQDSGYIKKRAERMFNPNERDVAQSLSPGRAELVAWGSSLGNWYPTLAPGKYQVTVTCRTGEEFNIVSNAAAFEVLASDAPATSQPAKP